MKIHIITGDVVIPGLDAFLGGETYEVPAEIGQTLIERNQAEEVLSDKTTKKTDTNSKKVREDK